MSALIKYIGGCHCGEVKYEVLAPSELHVYHCNCSICEKKQMPHFIVPASAFHLLSGHCQLSSYTFASHQAKHLFCAKCGVQSFFLPRCSPEIMAIVTTSVDSPLPLKQTVEPFDGQNWEQSVQKLDLPQKECASSSHSHL